MKIPLFIVLMCIQTGARAQEYRRHELLKDKLVIHLSDGVLNVSPLPGKAFRVQWEKKEVAKEEREFVLINSHVKPLFRFNETMQELRLITSDATVVFDKSSGVISFLDKSGKVVAKEETAGRRLDYHVVDGLSCYNASQVFSSTENEFLFGLGQFQDGHFNLRNVTRKLTQVNSQISIPFLYSSRGYGILWNQYGLTEFNPCDSMVPLAESDSAILSANGAEVTTTAGSQKISQRHSLFTGEFYIKEDGVYTMMLDLGNMDNRHLLIIDGNEVIDQSNLWLPPAVSKSLRLSAGKHVVQVICKKGNNPSLSWRLSDNTTTFRSPNAKSLDYILFLGKNADEVIRSYRNLTGNVPMLPLWAFGFWQCRERYTSGEHLVTTIREFRNRQLPVDVIVQDWQYWGKHGWGVPQFDSTHYPNPSKFIKELHDLHSRFAISVWENLDKKSAVAKQYLSGNLYIPNSPWIDIYNPATRTTHWDVLNKNLFSTGVDGWWMDATEPENDALKGTQTYFGPGNFYRLTYPLFVSQAVYEGQRKADPGKRVVILTRSAFAGQQRLGTINWSGDIGWSWDSYKRQIVAGLNYSLTGMPFWTTDIGGFFRPGPTQYTDTSYHDILTRWFQWGVFNPVFRIHGYQTETEPWKYGKEVESNFRKMLQLRYRLMPYIYSKAWEVSSNGSTMMRPLVMDFDKDSLAISRPYQYMFGESLLVCPVTAPATTWNVYLPRTASWYDFWTGFLYSGGQEIEIPAPKDRIPVFVKAGAILPLGKMMQYTGEKPNDTLEIRIYPGANANFTLYEDEGDNYNYEKGKYSTINFTWNEKSSTLSIGDLKGNYPGYLKRRIFNIVVVKKNTGGIGIINPLKSVVYQGYRMTVKTGEDLQQHK